MIYNRVQLYGESSAVKYPLDDLHTEAIPNDILLDLSISAPANMLPIVCTNIVCKPQYVFISFESASGAVGHVITQTPTPFTILPLTMSCEGSGWVVLGPGALKEFTIKGISVEVDRRCILSNISTSKKFKISVNGFEYDMPKILKIVSNASTLLSAETRTIDGQPKRALIISRNDLVLGNTIIKTGLINYDPEDVPISTLAGVSPDSAGNITLAFETETSSEAAYLVPAYNVEGALIGFIIITQGMNGCPDAYKNLDGQIKKSDTGYGSAEAMPLDCMFPPTPNSPSPTYPCPDDYDESSSS